LPKNGINPQSAAKYVNERGALPMQVNIGERRETVARGGLVRSDFSPYR
jgi:hypothetical protein